MLLELMQREATQEVNLRGWRLHWSCLHGGEETGWVGNESFLPLNVCHSVGSQWTTCVYFWAFNPMLFICVPILTLMTVVLEGVRWEVDLLQLCPQNYL